jgi:hypothetical protein
MADPGERTDVRCGEARMLHTAPQTWKSIRNARLRSILVDLPHDAQLVPTVSGNLLVYRGETGEEYRWECIGFVDVAEEAFVPATAGSG